MSKEQTKWKTDKSSPGSPLGKEMDIRTFFCNSREREKSTDSVEGAAAQESIYSVEGKESTISQQPTQSLRQADVH